MFILRLPDELLLEIIAPLFDHLPPPSSESQSSHPALCPSEPPGDQETKGQLPHFPYQTDGAVLLKVCRRFRRLAVPFIYNHLNVSFVTLCHHGKENHRCPSASNPDTGVLLYRTLSENPDLRGYCRTLRFTLPNPDYDVGNESESKDGAAGHDESEQVEVENTDTETLPGVTSTTAIDMATDIVSWLSNVKDLSITGYFIHAKTEAKMWNLVHTAGRSMPNLEKLSLGKERQVWLEGVCNLLRSSYMKQLRTLELGVVVVGMGLGGADFGHVVEFPLAVPVSANEDSDGTGATHEQEAQVVVDVVGASPVTSLSIDYLLAAPENLAQLLSVPAGLEYFAFNGMSMGCHFSWPLPMLISALGPHKTTLRTLRVASARQIGSDTTTYHPDLEGQLDRVDLGCFPELGGVTFIPAPL